MWSKAQCHSLLLKSHPVLGVVDGHVLCWLKLCLHAPKQLMAHCCCYFHDWLHATLVISGVLAFPYHTICRRLDPIRTYWYGSTGTWIWSYWLKITWTRTGVNLWFYFKTREYKSMCFSFIIIMCFSQDDSSLTTRPVFLFLLLLPAVGCPFSRFLQVLLLGRLTSPSLYQWPLGSAFPKTLIFFSVLHLSLFPPLPPLPLAQLFCLQNK